MAYEKYYRHYEDNGFHFNRSLLTRYCLSLLTKPFVIISGISGTGKTKIAQLFSAPATEITSTIATSVVNQEGASYQSNSWILMTITDGILSGDGRANFQYKDLSALLSPEEIVALEPRIKELRASGRDDNICDPFYITIENTSGEEILAMVYLQRASSPLVRVRFKSKRSDQKQYDSTSFFKKNYKLNDKLKLEKVGDKRLRITSLNDKSVIAESETLSAEEKLNVKNTCFISVRSDWTDSTPLFGYYNLIEQKYHITTVVAFLLKANENPNIPFFLILDEMNLAKVEHYFSDFLSCLESRHVENGKIIQEPIRLYAGSAWLETDDDYFDVIPPEINIPSNFFVTGTVNIDESTYMFSPKVLDRSNVIEINQVDFVGYANDQYETDNQYVLEKFPSFINISLPSKKDFLKLDREVKDFFIKINQILSKYNMHFGYRIINEISAYINNAVEFCNQSDDLINLSIDIQLIQKIFPKFNGPQSKLDLPIRELLIYLVGSQDSLEYFDLDAIQNLKASETKFPLSVAKLQNMYVNLINNGFANFVE